MSDINLGATISLNDKMSLGLKTIGGNTGDVISLMGKMSTGIEKMVSIMNKLSSAMNTKWDLGMNIEEATSEMKGFNSEINNAVAGSERLSSQGFNTSFGANSPPHKMSTVFGNIEPPKAAFEVQANTSNAMSAMNILDNKLQGVSMSAIRLDNLLDVNANTKQAVSSIMQVDNTMKGTSKIASTFKNTITRAMNIPSKGFTTASTAIKNFKNAVTSSEPPLTRLKTKVEGINSSLKKTANSSNLFKKALGGISQGIGIAVGGQIVQQVINLGKAFVKTADEMINTSARLDMIKDDLNTVDSLQQKIFDSAQRVGSSYASTADTVAKLSLRTGDMFSNDEAINFAENLNKMFVVAGASQEEMNSASLQLTQALGSGVLRGEELNAVFESAPNVIQTIADYMGKPIGAIREMASEGEITADIVKNAMLGATDSISEQFENMPMTFGRAWQMVKNEFIMALNPMINSVKEWLSSDTGKEFFSNIATGLKGVATVGGVLIAVLTGLSPVVNGVFGAIGTAVGGVIDLFKFIAPIILPVIYGVIAGLMLWGGVLAILNAKTALSTALGWGKIAMMAAYNAMVTIGSVLMGIMTGQITFATIAQTLFNSALLACPLTWIVIAIVAVIVAVFAFGASIEEVGGVVMGIVYSIGAVFYNVFATAWNTVASFVEFFANVWNHPLYSIKKLFADIWNGVLDLVGNAIDGILNLIGKIPFLNIEGGIGKGLTDKIKLDVGEAPSDYWKAPKMDLKDIGQSFDNGYKVGYEGTASIKDKIGGLFNSKDKNNSDDRNGSDGLGATIGMGDSGVEDIGKGVGTTNDHLSNIEDKLDVSNENLELLREMAELESIKNYITLTPSVNISIDKVENQSNVDDLIEKIEKSLDKDRANSSEGVYN